MFSRAVFNFFSGALLIIAFIPDAASYNKYGRTCKDIGCRTDETCVMAEDPCNGYTDKCGRYPTCRRTSDVSCTSMVCGENEYCKSENGAPKCVRKSTGLALPVGLNQVSHRSTTSVPSPPPRSSSYGGRYSGHSGSRNTVGDGSIFHRLFGNDRHPRPTSSARSTMQTNGNNYYNTHTHVDNYGNRIWTFSENEMRTRTIPKRQTSYPTATETHGSSDTSKNSDDQSYPARSSGYPSSSGYPGSSSYPSSSGYPGSSSYPSSSGYPGSSSYPNSGSSRASDSSNQPRSGYPNSGSGYPSSGSPSHSYSNSGLSGYPSSGSSNYPSRDSSGYPTGSAYPSKNSGSSGYPDNSRNFYGEETVRRTGASAVNAGYPSNPRTSVYPEGNPSYGGNYPAQNTGYPHNNQHSPHSNQGYSNGYPQNYPQGGYYPQAGYYPEGRYQGQNYMTTTKRPGIRDQLTNFARNMAEKVLTQTILDRVTGRH
ncbi:protein SPT2 homolog isoform X2 [Mycetomoellerius zeteki]|uniref:protein SPT2 homolog isoform X2 n=1 Tax=Mycetomoellerius zeteki TaxID=64791 RepID=UPI00084EC322|nr:PREDICTED: protein SPT2 homolog isoform X2 [Trachymyrmex zeteki]